MATPVEITAVYLGERFSFANDSGGAPTIIADARLVEAPGGKPDTMNGSPLFAVKGPAETDELTYNGSYKFFGRWTSYNNKRSGKIETQFAFESFVETRPNDRAGIIAYLAKAGEGHGIGKQRAAKIFDLYGQDAVRMCREEPAAVAGRISGWSVAEAELLAAALIRSQAIEDCLIKLNQLFDRRGFPKSAPKRCIDLWGNAAVEIVRHDPYKLMGVVRGAGFRRCDNLYLALGLPPARLKRQALCAWYSIAADTDGNTWFPVEQAIAGIKAQVSGCELQITKALKLAKRADVLSFQRTDTDARLTDDPAGRLWVAETKKADQEEFIARQLAEASREPHQWPDVSELFGLSDHQREKLGGALTGTIAILGGAPGTGKTYAAAALILKLLRIFGEGNIAVAAPTGKAAVRITEALANYEVPLRARTIHSLLEIDLQPDGSWGFKYRLGRPLPYKVIIVDESSMIDSALMASLLAARNAGCLILFVGDINQLPPVGSGAPLRDMILAGLPCGELREIRRNCGMIVEACAAIRDGESNYRTLAGLEVVDIEAGKNLVRIEATTPDQQKSKMLETIDWSVRQGFDPIWDCQVLAAVNAKSPLSRKELNRLLQEKLNHQPAIEGSPFRLGDKIVNTKNGRYKVAPQENEGSGGQDGEDFGDISGSNHDADLDGNGKPLEVYVANGDLARVVAIEEKSLLAKLAIGGAIIRIPRGKPGKDSTGDEADGDPDPNDDSDKSPNTGCMWDLAYCLSCHKSQGSEWPVVIVLLDEYQGARRICSREWLFTAISRGKKLTVEVGKAGVARRMVGKVALGDRKTFLRERIEVEMCKVLVESL